MPIGKGGVGHCVDPLGVHRVADVEQDAVARTRARRQLQRGEHRDVVAVIGLRGALRAVAMIAAAPQPGDFTRFGIGKHARAFDDPGCGGIGHRNLDYVD